MSNTASIKILMDLEDKVSGKMKDIGTGFSKFEGQIKEMGPTFTKMAAIGTAGFAAITGAVGLSVKQYANAGDAIQKMALRTGFSTIALSELKHAAELSGTSIETLEGAITIMSRNLIGNSEKISDALGDNLLTPMEDIMGMNPEEKFFALAESVAEISDPTERAAAAMAVFGKSGTQLLPMLAEGADGIQRMRDEAHELGIVFDEDAANAAALFNDNMDRLGKSMDGVKFALAEAFIPVLTELVDNMRPAIIAVQEWLKENPELARTVITVTAAIFGIVAVLGTLGLVLPSIIVGIKGVGAAMMFLSANPIVLVVAAVVGLVALFAALVKETGGVGNAFKAMGETLVSWWKNTGEWVYEKIMKMVDAFKQVSEFVGGKISGITGSLFGGGKASGGPVTGGTSYLVGERGPELFTPLSSGNIVPNHSLAGAGGMVLNVTITGNSFMGKEGIAREIGNEIMDQLRLRERLRY